MKSLVKDIRDYIDRRTKAKDASKTAHVSRRTLVIQNGESAKRLLKNEDFALLFHLYRFEMLERLEASTDDKLRIVNATYVAGVRDFVEFIEIQEHLANEATKVKED